MHDMYKTILPGELVFDVGANAGVYADYFLSRGARVVAVEPQPTMIRVLQDKFAGNSDLTIVSKGAGAAPGSLTMHINTASPVLSTFDPSMAQQERWKGQTWDQTETIEITTIDALIEEHGVPRFIKIDVENYEKQVIMGLTRKVQSLSIEFVPERIQETRDIIWYARGLGFKKFNIGLGSEPGFFVPTWVGADEVMTYITRFCADNPMIWGDVYMC